VNRVDKTLVLQWYLMNTVLNDRIPLP